MHPDLTQAMDCLYRPSDLVLTQFTEEPEGQDYAASEFLLGDLQCKFRVAKLTPKKIGFFVTLWKRTGNGPTLPHDLSDPFDLYIVSVNDSEHFGQFLFPKEVLAAQGVLSIQNKGGKRGIRVYPPWTTPTNHQALSTQSWQCEHFIFPGDPLTIYNP